MTPKVERGGGVNTHQVTALQIAAWFVLTCGQTASVPISAVSGFCSPRLVPISPSDVRGFLFVREACDVMQSLLRDGMAE